MYAGIGKLAPAERMIVRADGSMVRDEYWTPLSPALTEEVRRLDDEDIVEEFRARLRTSVGRRMMSDVPYGVFLSGGLDSSTNVALLAELSETPVRTFSTAPRDFPAYDELRWARLVAERFGTDHREVQIDETDLESYLPQLLEAEDEPLADWTAVPQHFVSRLARESGTIVVQVGEGADEILHGYRGYADHRMILAPFQRYVPGAVRGVLGEMAVYATRRTGRGIRHGEALWDAAHSPLPYWGGALCFRGRLKTEILANGWAATLPESYERVEALWRDIDNRMPDADLFQRMTYIELKQRLPELLLARLDRVGMANSIEGREPFLDHEFVEFCFALPPHMKYRGGQGKQALRQAMMGVLPRGILDRKKQGFGTPMREWLRDDFGRRAERAVMRSTLADRGLLDYRRVEQLFRAHRAGGGDWSPHLWNLYSVSVWHDRWVAGAGAR
jgi:asparagine synthase (glutamine-hydrolysing)